MEILNKVNVDILYCHILDPKRRRMIQRDAIGNR